MALAHDLLELSEVTLAADSPSEAALRRATSTAYYALFHLLISEATANRPLFGRMFEHGKMKSACNQILELDARVSNRQPKKRRPEIPFEQPTTADHLCVVAKIFVQTQEWREFADYDMASIWKAEDPEAQVLQIVEAFRSWAAIREEFEAQKFLVLLLEPKQRASRT